MTVGELIEALSSMRIDQDTPVRIESDSTSDEITYVKWDRHGVAIMFDF